MPVGFAKTETGTLMTNLGKDFYLSRRRAKSTPEKVELYDHWTLPKKV